MKILAFAASSSTTSINKQLVRYAAGLLRSATVEIADLNDYELPLFSVDREKELGSPALAQSFFAKIGDCDALIISFAEHNGSYSAAYKNLFDWCSRINPKVFQNKPTLMLATSPGKRGGRTVLEAAVASAPRFAADLRGHLSIPSFYENFDTESESLKSPEMREKLIAALNSLM